jgi:hypothetical protein
MIGKLGTRLNAALILGLVLLWKLMTIPVSPDFMMEALWSSCKVQASHRLLNFFN